MGRRWSEGPLDPGRQERMFDFTRRGLTALATGVVLASLSLCGCGASSSSTTGNIQVSIDRGTKAKRLIPANTQSLVVNVLSGATSAAATTLTGLTADGTSSYTFTGLAPGTYTVTVSAYDTAQGTGDLLATGSNSNVVVTAGATASAPLTLTSEVAAAQVSLSNAEVPANAGTTVTATLTCYQTDGVTAVPVTPADVTWSITNPNGTTVATETANADGTCTITVADGSVAAGGTSVDVTITGTYKETGSSGDVATATANATLQVDASTDTSRRAVRSR